MSAPETSQPSEPLEAGPAVEDDAGEASPAQDEAPAVPRLPPDLETLIREVFTLFELKGGDKKGEVEEKDVPTLIRGLGLNPTEAQLEELLAEMRTPVADAPKSKGPPTVTFEKLEYAVRRAVSQRPAEFRRTPKETLLKALRAVDTGHKGCFEAEELKNLVMSSSTHPFSEEEAAELLQAATDSKTGKVYIDDVVELLGRDRSLGLSKMLEPASA
ncbi:hypothetical protein KFL_001300290 [Klebsormidium nitens]|uniref:EF-hand domain-containing protein n=1 Tax=Klebsormidium nitens TaxID=105231 RepID=A0A1Y1HWF6_KLENI|nr:hypothetical protein KFL_001300290 [Klebsormidium nitens]|eukprot:GAQ82965.1 hypothetical protein KFL_001300290 [Klebsormidium nitens]